MVGTAIAMNGAQNVVLRNVGISGCRKGIEATNSNLLLDNVHIQRSGIGLDLVNSQAAIHNSKFIENQIDVVVNSSTAYMINTIARRILQITPKGD